MKVKVKEKKVSQNSRFATKTQRERWKEGILTKTKGDREE